MAMNDKRVKAIFKSEAVTPPDGAKQAALRLALDAARAFPDRDASPQPPRSRFPRFSGRFAARLAAAALAVVLLAGGLTLASLLDGRHVGESGLIFMVAHAEQIDGEVNMLTTVVDGGIGAELPIKTKLALRLVPQGARQSDRDAILRAVRSTSERAIGLMHDPYTSCALYDGIALSFSSDSILSFGINDAEKVESVSVVCGENGFFELFSGDHAHRRRYRESFRCGSRAELSSESFKELFLMENGEETRLYIWWRPSEAAALRLAKAGSTAPSMITDTLYVTVNYKDGRAARAHLALSFSDDGVLAAEYKNGAPADGTDFSNSREANALPEHEQTFMAYELTSMFSALDIEQPKKLSSTSELLRPIWMDRFETGELVVLSYTKHPGVDEASPSMKLSFIDPRSDRLIKEVPVFCGSFAICGDTLYQLMLDAEPSQDEAAHAYHYGLVGISFRKNAGNEGLIVSYSKSGERLGEARVEASPRAVEERSVMLFDAVRRRAVISEYLRGSGLQRTAEIDLASGRRIVRGGDKVLLGSHGSSVIAFDNVEYSSAMITAEKWSLKTDGKPVSGGDGKKADFSVRRIDPPRGRFALLLESPRAAVGSSYIGSTRDEERVLLIDLEAGSKRELVFDTRSESLSAFASSDGKYVVTVSTPALIGVDDDAQTTTLRVYDAETNALIKGVTLPAGNRCHNVDPIGNAICTIDGRTVFICIESDNASHVARIDF